MEYACIQEAHLFRKQRHWHRTVASKLCIKDAWKSSHTINQPNFVAELQFTQKYTNPVTKCQATVINTHAGLAATCKVKRSASYPVWTMPDKKTETCHRYILQSPRSDMQKKFVSCVHELSRVHELLSCYHKLVSPANEITFCSKKNFYIMCTRYIWFPQSCANEILSREHKFFSACPLMGSVASSMHNSWLLEIQIKNGSGYLQVWCLVIPPKSVKSNNCLCILSINDISLSTASGPEISYLDSSFPLSVVHIYSSLPA